MLSITYISIRTSLLEDDVLTALIAGAAARNKQRSITGRLITCNYFIVQTIEGEDADVEHLFAAISTDPRHTGVEVLERKQLNGRQFSSWMVHHTIGVKEFANILREFKYETRISSH